MPSKRSSSTGPAPRRRTGPVIAVGAVVAAVVVAAGATWALWPDGDPGGGDTATSSSSSTSTDTSTGPSSSTSESPSPSESPEPTRTTGSVEVGTVVSHVGQPCQFSDVGLRETTSDGVEVICEQADGGYSWERAD